MIVMYAKTIRGRNVMTLYFYEDRLNIISMNAANGAKNDVLSSAMAGVPSYLFPRVVPGIVNGCTVSIYHSSVTGLSVSF